MVVVFRIRNKGNRLLLTSLEFSILGKQYAISLYFVSSILHAVLRRFLRSIGPILASHKNVSSFHFH
jgi:hypothetical protein